MSNAYSFGLPLKHNFVEFLYYEGFFLPHEIEKIRQFWDKEKIEKAEVSGDEKYKDELRKSSLVFIESDEKSEWLFNRMGTLAMSTNNNYYHFDLLGFHRALQLATYSEGDFFDWHLDFGPGDISSRKLSLTVQLSDPEEYEGGDLQFMINQNIVTAPKKKGTVIIFPSFIMHRVTPITKGHRQSIVGWVDGPPYR